MGNHYRKNRLNHRKEVKLCIGGNENGYNEEQVLCRLA